MKTVTRIAAIAAVPVLILGIFVCGTSLHLWAQGAVSYAELIGDVGDKTGAAIAGATVTVVNKSTNQSRTAANDANEHFSVLQLPPGDYVVKVEQSTATAPSTSTSRRIPRKPRKMPAWISVRYAFITASRPRNISEEVARMIDTNPRYLPTM